MTLSMSMRVNNMSSHGSVDTRMENFNNWLLNIGDGKVPAIAKKGEVDATWIKIPYQHLLLTDGGYIQILFESTHPYFNNFYHDEGYLRERSILTVVNEVVDKINDYIF